MTVTKYPFVSQSKEPLASVSFSMRPLPSDTFTVLMLYRIIQTAPCVLDLQTSFTLDLDGNNFPGILRAFAIYYFKAVVFCDDVAQHMCWVSSGMRGCAF